MSMLKKAVEAERAIAAVIEQSTAELLEKLESADNRIQTKSPVRWRSVPLRSVAQSEDLILAPESHIHAAQVDAIKKMLSSAKTAAAFRERLVETCTSGTVRTSYSGTIRLSKAVCRILHEFLEENGLLS